MVKPAHPRATTALTTVVLLLAALVTTGLLGAPRAAATTTDLVAAVSAPNTTTYEQSFARTDGPVTAGYALSGPLTQNATPTQALPQRNSAAVQFSPAAVGTSTVAQVNYAPKAACGANKAAAVVTDCGTAGSVTVTFTRPVANPTVHVVGLGEQRGPNAYGAYLRVRSAVTTDAANTARFGTVQAGSGLTVSGSGNQLSASAVRPDAQCGGASGCGSAALVGTTFTSITFDVGVRTANSDGTSGITPADVDTFDLTLSIPDAAPTGARLSCADDTVYSVVGGTRDLFRVDTTTGVKTLAGGFAVGRGGNANGLAITPNGAAAYAVEAATTAGGPTRVLRYDAVSGARTVHPGPTLTQTTVNGSVIFGAIDPVSRNYYFGLNTTTGVELYGFDVDTNTPIVGRVAVVTGIPRLANGDMAFDADGRLYIAAASANNSDNPLFFVPGAFPAQGRDTRIAAVALTKLRPNDARFNSAAFSGGYLYVGGLAPGNLGFINKIDPSDGRLVATSPLTYRGETDTDVSDMGSCQTPNPLRARANIVNRVDADDEFGLEVRSVDPSSSARATTTGGGLGLRAAPGETAGPLLAIGARTYTVTETAGNATTALADYATTYECTRNDDGDVLTRGAGRQATFTYPVPPDNEGIGVTCIFTNTASTLSLTKTDPPTMTAGQEAVYRFGVRNSGPGQARGATVLDELPAGVDYVSSTGAGWTCTAAGRRLTCTYTGTIAAGATNSALAVTVAPAAAAAGATLVNRAAVDPTGRADPVDPGGCTATGSPAGCAVTPGVTVADVVTARDDLATTAPGVPVTTDVRSNDSTAAGTRPGAPVVVAGPSDGTAEVVDGNVVYTPRAGFAGEDTYGYRVCSDITETACATATVTVAVVNTVIANGDVAAVAQNGSVTTNVLANDTVSPEGPALNPASVTVVDGPRNGTAVPNPDGTITYTPRAGFTGEDGYGYEVCDSAATPVCASASVTLTVGTNVVVAGDDYATTTPETPVTIAVRANDSSTTGQPFAVPELLAEPSRGSAEVVDGDVVYTPRAGTSGVDTVTYRVCDTSVPGVCAVATVRVSVQNTVSAAPDEAATPQNAAVRVEVLGNDTVSPGGAQLDPGSVRVGTAPERGTATVADGVLTYTPNPGVSGTDTLTYEVCDGSEPDPTCASATVTVTVAPNVVTTGPADATTPPVTPVAVALTSDSASGQALARATVIRAPARGTATPNDDGTITYTPADGFSGVDTLAYEVCDTSDIPVCATGTATIRVVNEVTAVDDPDVTVAQNGSAGTAVLNNDTTSPGGAALDPGSVTITTASEHGTVVVEPDGVIVYTPTRGYSGPDSYGYTVCDSSEPEPVCDAAAVSVTVAPNVITAVDDRAATTAGTAVTINVLANDTSASSQALARPAVETGPTGGEVVVEADGRITYTPRPGFSGVDTLTYRACDTSIPTLCSEATATLTITVVRSVTATADGVAVAPGESVEIRVLNNDTVTPGGAALDPASVDVISPPTSGTATPNPDGTITYRPDPGFSGDDTFTYTVCDSSPTPECDTATVTVRVEAGIVVADADAATTTPRTAVTIDVRSNDTTSAGGRLGPPGNLGAPGFGTAVVGDDGRITYTPDDASSGVDSFTYTVCDDLVPAVCDTATVTITVVSGVVAVSDVYETPVNTPISPDVTANDTVTEGGAPLDVGSVSVVVPPSNGTATTAAAASQVPQTAAAASQVPLTAAAASQDTLAAAAGRVVYTPDGDFVGVDVFDYQVCDTSVGAPSCDTTSVTITVVDPAQPPTVDPTPPTPITPDPVGPDPTGPVPPAPPTDGPPTAAPPTPGPTPVLPSPPGPPTVVEPLPSGVPPAVTPPNSGRPDGPVDRQLPSEGGTVGLPAPAGERQGPLAFTGAVVIPIAAVGLGALAIGGALVWIGRRR